MASLNDLQKAQSELAAATAVGASGAAVTLTIPAPPTDVFAYLQRVEVVQYAVAALTGGATPVTVTTTNLNGAAFTFPTAQAIGLNYPVVLEGPVKGAAAATAITIVCPATTSVIWRVNATYFYA